MTRKYEPKSGDWKSTHYSPKVSDNCRMKLCPECGKPACLDWWKDIEHEGYKVLAFRHGHWLKDTFEQKRNYNHVDKDTRVKLKPGEVVDTTRMKPADIPDHIADKFKDV